MEAKEQKTEAQLLQEQRRDLIRFLTNKLGNPDDAQELAQDALIRIHSLSDTTHIDNHRAYMYQVAANLATDQLRRRQLFKRYSEGEAVRLQLVDECYSPDAPDEMVAARQQLERLRDVLNGLSFNCRQTLMLHRVRGLTYSQIAVELGVSVSSIEKYMLEALRQLREHLLR